MPHIKRWLIDGKVAPSVNQVTDMIPKDWLINWYRKVGFKKADEVSKTSRDHGTNVHDLFDQFWKGTLDINTLTELEKAFVMSLAKWARETRAVAKFSEPHLESKKHLVHGSPDLVLEEDIADYKIKGDKYPDYKTILNEAGYALMYEEMHGIKLKNIRILNFDKETGELVKDLIIPIESQFTEDFLSLRRAYDVKVAADAWDEKHIRSKFKKRAA